MKKAMLIRRCALGIGYQAQEMVQRRVAERPSDDHMNKLMLRLMTRSCLREFRTIRPKWRPEMVLVLQYLQSLLAVCRAFG